jgi:hypothetical protein
MFPVADRDRVEALPLEDHRQHLGDRGVVVDDENLGSHDHQSVTSGMSEGLSGPARQVPPASSGEVTVLKLVGLL